MSAALPRVSSRFGTSPPLWVPLLVALLAWAPGPAHAGPLAEARLACLAGAEALARGDDAEAVARFEEATSLDPGLARAHQGRGLALLRLGRTADALAALEEAARLEPEAPAVRFDLALAYLGAGDDFWAADELALAADLAPNDARIALVEGAVLLALRDDRGATRALERANLASLADEPSQAQLGLYRGVAALRLGELEEARVAFREAAALGADANPWAGAAGDASAALVRLAWAVPPPWQVSARVAGQVDTNVTLEPESGTEALGASAAGLALSAQLTASPLATDAHLLSATLDVGRVSHFAEGPDQLSLTTGALGAAYRHRVAGASGWTHLFTVGGAYELVFLDGGELTDEADWHAYREAVGGRLRYGLEDGHRHRAFVEVAAARAWLSDMRRDGWSLVAELGDTVSFAGGRLKLLVAGRGRYDLAAGRGFDLFGVGGRAGLSALLPWSLEAATQLAFEHRDHFDSDGYAGWGAHGRRDDVLTASASLRRPLWGPLSAELAVIHAEHDSTVANYAYRRSVVSLGLLGRWP
jgi:Flp pilus assembly protein TadD